MLPREALASSTQFAPFPPGPRQGIVPPGRRRHAEGCLPRATGVTVTVALRAALPKLAVIVTGDASPTEEVVIVNVALDCPPTTDTVAGTQQLRCVAALHLHDHAALRRGSGERHGASRHRLPLHGRRIS